MPSPRETRAWAVVTERGMIAVRLSKREADLLSRYQEEAIVIEVRIVPVEGGERG